MKIYIKTLFIFILLQQMAPGQSKFMNNFSLEPGLAAGTQSPPSNSISHIDISGISVFIGTGNGLAKTSDGGRSWHSYVDDPAFTRQGIFAVSSLEETVWAAMGFEKDVDGGGVQTGAGYALTLNGGITWNHVGQTLDQQADSIISYCPEGYPCVNDSVKILPVIVPEQNVTFDISVTSGSVWVAGWASGLRKTTDQGLTWQRILLPLDEMDSISPFDTLYSFALNDTLRLRRIFKKFDPRKNNNMLAFSVYAASPETIWCGTADGVNLSFDGGLSWVKMNHQNQASPILGNWVISIGEQRFSDVRRVWITNWRAEDNSEEFGVSYTDDFGKTWENLLHGVRAYGFAFKDSITYIATEAGVYRTDDGGDSFTGISNITDTSSHQYIYSANVYSVGILGDSVYVGTNEGFAKTIDNDEHPFGRDWEIFRTYEQVGTSARTYAYPNPFAPSASLPASDGFVRIHYGKRSEASGALGTRSVTIEIFDFGMNRVRTLLNNAQRPAGMELDELWDGRNDGGYLVANGVYFYSVKSDDDEPAYGKILVLQ